MHQLKTRSIHIVKRYGKVGGMERYVWELTHHLADQGHQVAVLCEQQYGELTQGQHLYDIQVMPLGSSMPKLSRWISMLIFSSKVHRKIQSINSDAWIIHSHERTADHDISTFHGSSIHFRRKSILDRLSPRLFAWTWMERREVSGRQVQAVIPVSDLSRRQLLGWYPHSENVIWDPVFPAVDPHFSGLRKSARGKIIGFIGKEWKRKGLDILVRSVRRLRMVDNNFQLIVAGCDPKEVEHLFHDWSDGFQLLGWVSPEKVFSEIDLLVLPSRKEPFGMVAAEANAAGLPVIVSDRCGIAPLINERIGRVFSTNSPEVLDELCVKLLKQTRPVGKLNLQWGWVAAQYALLYRALIKSKPSVVNADVSVDWLRNMQDLFHHNDTPT